MEHAAFHDPALTIALAAVAGMLAQTVARHIRVPGIVLLLVTAAGAALAARLILGWKWEAGWALASSSRREERP